MRAAPLAGGLLGTINDGFIVAEWTDRGGPPGPPRLIAPLHVHHHEDEAWYVLEGRLCVRLGDEEVEAPAGSGVFGPRGVPHTFWNPTEGPTRYLVVMMPETCRLIEELHTLPDREPATVRALFLRHGCDLLS